MTSVVGLAWIPAHVALPAEPPGPATLLLGWVLEPLPTAAIAVAAVAWWLAVGRVDRAHPANPVPKRRSVAFFGGLLAIAFALLSGIEAYATTLFSAHMVQHILLTLVAAPLLAMSAPITLLLRVASHQSRRRWILPALHSRLLRFLTFPVVAWLLFAGVMWVTHFSPLFEAALDDPLVHDLEHVLFLTSALLFWLPAVALDPGPWRMPHPVRALYIFMQMPQNTFLAVVLLNASSVLYPHYASLARPWGILGLDDQRLAAGLMWVAGDAIFVAALGALIWGWMRAEGRDTERADRRADLELAEIHGREGRLAARIAREREEAQPGSGVSR